MLVMRTVEDPTDPIGKLVSTKQSIRLNHFALAVNPLGLYGVQPRTLLGKKAAYDPHSAPAPLDLLVMFSEPSSHLAAYVPACVVPDEDQHFLASSFELLRAPPEKLSRYRAHGPPIHEPQPHIIEFGQVESVAGDGLGLGIVFGDRPLDEAKGLSFFRPATQGGQGHPAPPALIQEAHRPIRIGLRYSHQSVAPSFFRSYRGSGEVIQRLALCQRTPSRRARVARMVSPETRLWVSPSSKATCAAISNVQRLLSWANSLGERWSISRNRSAPSSSKASRVLLGREDLAARASRPLWLKSWMASRTVCCPQPRLRAILGAYSPLELASKIWHRRKVKAFFERNPAWRSSRSSSENERTRIGVFMVLTVTRNTKPILKMH